jgi:large subunit ribosomal protein L5
LYEFLERLIRVSLPRIRDFKGIAAKFDGRGNYTLGIQEQIIFPEINIDQVSKLNGMNITFVTLRPDRRRGLCTSQGLRSPIQGRKKIIRRYGKRINESS